MFAFYQSRHYKSFTSTTTDAFVSLMNKLICVSSVHVYSRTQRVKASLIWRSLAPKSTAMLQPENFKPQTKKKPQELLFEFRNIAPSPALLLLPSQFTLLFCLVIIQSFLCVRIHRSPTSLHRISSPVPIFLLMNGRRFLTIRSPPNCAGLLRLLPLLLR